MARFMNEAVDSDICMIHRVDSYMKPINIIRIYSLNHRYYQKFMIERTASNNIFQRVTSMEAKTDQGDTKPPKESK